MRVELVHDSSPRAGPELSPNIVRAGVQQAIALFMLPQKWIAYVAEVKLRLAPDFCLLDLTRNEWSDASIRKFLISASVVPTLLTMLAIPITYRFAGDWSIGLLILLLLSLCLSLAAAVIVSITTSIAWISFLLLVLLGKFLFGAGAISEVVVKESWAILCGLSCGIAGIVLANFSHELPRSIPRPSRLRQMLALLMFGFPGFHLRMPLDLLEGLPFLAAFGLLGWLIATFVLEWDWQNVLGISLAVFWLGPIVRDGGFHFPGLQCMAAWFYLSFILARSIAGPEIAAIAAALAVGIWAGSFPFHELFYATALRRSIWAFSPQGLLWAAASTLSGLALAWSISKFVRARKLERA